VVVNPKSFNLWRLVAMGRDRPRCDFCPNNHDLEEHHVIPRRFGGLDQPENIVRVCQRCHRKLERLYDRTFYEWFGIDDRSGRREFHRPCFINSCGTVAQLKVEIYGVGAVEFVCDEHYLAHRHRVLKQASTSQFEPPAQTEAGEV
jgi:hypothetical protein